MTAAGAAVRLRLAHIAMTALSAGSLLLGPGVPLSAQEWRVGAQFGRVSYAGAVSNAAQSSTLSLGGSRLGTTDWVGASVGIPLADDPFWGVAGVWKRWQTGGAAGLGVDLSAHAFMQRDPQAGDSPLSPLPVGDEAVPERSGEGGGGELAVVAFGSTGPARAELRAGGMAQGSRVSDVESSEFLPFSEASVLFSFGALQLGPEAKVWLGDSARSYAGLTAYGSAGPADLWASGGSWLAGGPEDLTWSAGAAVPLGRIVRLEGSYRSGSYDPLYDSSTTSSFTVGASVRVAGGAGVSAPTPARYEDGRALIRIRSRDVEGQPRIAGDFNGWQPQPMVAEGGHWTFTVPLEPGVYNYAFVDAEGEWFVPEWIPGRRSDGMGGYVAVLVIS